MTSLFNELKRRNVIRVGAAYLVAAWVLLQIGDVLISMLQLPPSVGKALVLIFSLGFPLTLIFAWAFELTPEGIKVEADVDRSESITNVTAKKLDMVTIGLVIVALAVFLSDRFLWSEPVYESAVPEETTATVAADASVAVLPFSNISQSAENEPFTIGIHDDLLTQISKISSLKTISRTSVMPYRDTTKPISQIAGELGVATILEGGVQRAGDTVRINVQLIGARNNQQLWGERYERQLTAANIFVIQSEIVKAIADALNATLSPAEEERIDTIPTENLQALEYFFAGTQSLAQRNTWALEEAAASFEKAIELDPEFALAYVGIADSYQLQEDAGGLPREEMFRKAGAALEKALLLDPYLAAAYSSMGGIRWTAGDSVGAEASFKRSLELNPNYSQAYLWYGTLLVELGRIREAVRIYKEGIERDPLSAILNESLGTALEFQGRFNDAIQQYRRSIEIEPSFASSYLYTGNVYWTASSKLQQASICQRDAIEHDRGARLPRTWHGLLYLDLGDVDSAEPWIKSALLIADQGQEPKAAMALLKLFRGDDAGAQNYAEEAQAIFPYYPDQRLFQSMMLALLRNYDLKRGDVVAARAWYENAYPELLGDESPTINLQNYRPAIDLALVLQQSGDAARADVLLNRTLRFIETGEISRRGTGGYGIADVQIHALLGEQQRAISALRQAVNQGWRGFWWFYLKDNPNLASLQGNAEFESIVSEVETSMLGQKFEVVDSGVCDVVADLPL